MKFSSFLYCSVFASGILAAPYPSEDSGYVKLPVSNRRSVRSTRVKRDDKPEEQDLGNDIYQYTADLKIGTPGQGVEVLLDTGSSDLWVFSNQANSPEENTFNPDKSKSYQFLNDDFEISYVSGSAKGDWVKDNVQLGDSKVEKQRFAVVNKTGSDSDIGIFGIGPTANEASSDGQYPNFPQSLVDQKKIKKNAYSLYLDDWEASSGSILFGAVDSSKYKGDLLTVPWVSDQSLDVAVSINGSNTFEGSLDCGTSLTYIPSQLVEKYAKKFGAEWDNDQGLYFLDDVIDGSLEFDFSGAKVSVPGDELAIKAEKYDVKSPPKPYVFTFLANDQTNGMNLLGDSFLRSAYVVFDLKDKEVAIAQASYDSKNSNIQAIENDIPGAKKAPKSGSGNTDQQSGNKGAPDFLQGMKQHWDKIFGGQSKAKSHY